MISNHIRIDYHAFPFSALLLLHFISQACRPPSLPASAPHLDVVVLEQDDFRCHISNVHDLHHHHALRVRVQLFIKAALQALGLVTCDGGEAFVGLGRLMMRRRRMKGGREGGNVRRGTDSGGKAEEKGERTMIDACVGGRVAVVLLLLACSGML